VSDTERISGQVIFWVARLLGLLVVYLLIRYFKPTIFYKS
jgi:hypothetical protein